MFSLVTFLGVEGEPKTDAAFQVAIRTRMFKNGEGTAGHKWREFGSCCAGAGSAPDGGSCKMSGSVGGSSGSPPAGRRGEAESVSELADVHKGQEAARDLRGEAGSPGPSSHERAGADALAKSSMPNLRAISGSWKTLIWSLPVTRA